MDYSHVMQQSLNVFTNENIKGGFDPNVIFNRNMGTKFIRLPGPLSQNNVTGLCLAIGTVLSIATTRLGYPVIGKVLLIICITSLFSTMARTAIISTLIGLFIYISMVPRNRKLISTCLASFVILLLFVVFYYYYFSAALQLMNPMRIMNTLIYISSHLLQLLTLDRLYNVVFGSGFSYVDYKVNIFGPVLSSELFFAQLITMYGLFPLILFITSVLRRSFKLIKLEKYKSFYGPDYIIVLVSFIVIIMMLVSTIHESAMVRPQLFPIFFIFLSIISRYELYRDKNTMPRSALS